jgi:hypothetical protein
VVISMSVSRFNDTPTRTTPRARSLHSTEKYKHTKRKRRKDKPFGSAAIDAQKKDNYDLFHATHPDLGQGAQARTWRANRQD